MIQIRRSARVDNGYGYSRMAYHRIGNPFTSLPLGTSWLGRPEQ
jgi:hypothetical protein